MEILIRFAKISDKEQLKNIWNVCFGDEDAYIDTFFSNCFYSENTVVAEISERVVGVIYMLPAILGKQKFMYGYAIGVLPEFRGNGICEKMHKFILADMKDKGYLYGLHPANEKLYTYYRSIGLHEMYSLRVYENRKSDAAPITLKFEVLESAEYHALREKAFSPLVSWNQSMLSYIVDETKKYGGFAKKIWIDGKERFLFGIVLDKTVLVKETSLSDAEILKYSDSIMDFFDSDKIVFYLPITSNLGNAHGMILGFGDENKEIYMNLFLD